MLSFNFDFQRSDSLSYFLQKRPDKEYIFQKFIEFFLGYSSENMQIFCSTFQLSVPQIVWPFPYLVYDVIFNIAVIYGPRAN